MSNLRIITKENIGDIKEFGPGLAETYKVAFAGPPWFEVSRCATINCTTDFSAEEPGCPCRQCGEPMSEAYSEAGLLNSWQDIVESDGLIELEILRNQPQRATIVRPTNPVDLFERKYSYLPDMKDWLQGCLPSSFVWVEDSFANRVNRPMGNLIDRGKTLQKVSDYYGGLQIATRTLSEAIVASTVRDKKCQTAVYIGTKGVGARTVSNAFDNPGYELPSVPDRRTLLIVGSRKAQL